MCQKKRKKKGRDNKEFGHDLQSLPPKTVEKL